MPLLTPQSLDAALAALPVVPGDAVLIHSSLAALGPVRGTPAEHTPPAVLAALRQRLGPDCDLVMPAFHYDFPQTGHCDLRTAPSTVGALTELFRASPGVSRSCHPMFSLVAQGPGAETLLRPGQAEAQPFGPESTFARLCARNALVVLLGAQFRHLTCFVYSERGHGVRYRFDKPFAGTVTGLDGREHAGPFFHFCLPRTGEVQPEYSRAWADLLRLGLAERLPAGLGSLSWFRLGAVHTFLGQQLQRDPWYLVANRPQHFYAFENGREIMLPETVEGGS